MTTLALSLLVLQLPLVNLEPGFTPASSEPLGYAAVAGTTVFVTDRPGVHQLWRSNGGSVGTLLVREWATAQSGSLAPRFGALGAGAAFWMEELGEGYEPWFTDGTAPGTFRLADTTPGQPSGFLGAPPPFTLHQGRLYFPARLNFGGMELWSTDGTPAGTQPVIDLDAGAPRDLVSLGAELFFLTDTALWATDGTAVGTRRVENFSMFAAPDELTALGGQLLFGAGQGMDRELWTSDGTMAGTQLLADLNASGSSSPEDFVVQGPQAYFRAQNGASSQRRLFVTDGTAAGTRRIVDADVRETAAIDTRAAWLGFAGGGFVLGVTDGTPSGATTLPIPFSEGLLSTGDAVVYETFDPGAVARNITISDGTVGGTVELFQEQDYEFGPFATAYTGDRLWFSGWTATNGREPWTSDGTLAGTALVLDINSSIFGFGSDPRNLARVGERLFFSATVGGADLLFGSDGSAAGTVELAPEPGAPPFGTFVARAELNGLLYFASSDGRELWRTDGTPAGTQLAVDLSASIGAGGQGIAELHAGDDLLFVRMLTGPSGSELWRSDGTPAGSFSLQVSASFVTSMRFLSPLLHFQASNAGSGAEPWISDGELAGTRLLADVVPGPGSSNAGLFQRFAGDVYFAANTPAEGLEVWRVKPDLSGAELAFQVGPGASGSVRQLLSIDDRLIVVALDDDDPQPGNLNHMELWSSLGTQATTSLVQSFPAGALAPNAGRAFAGTDRVYFYAPNFAEQDRVWLWRTLGAANNTQALAPFELYSSFGNTGWGEFTTIPGSKRAYFWAETPGEGRELWTTNGSAASTVSVTGTLWPGSPGADPAEIVRVESDLFFAGNHPGAGREVLTLSLADVGSFAVEAFGSGCTGSAGPFPAIGATGDPLPGGSISVTLSEATPVSPALLAYSMGLVPLELGTCTTFPAAPFQLQVTATDGLGSAAIDATLPNVSQAIGATFYLQWAIARPGGPLFGAFDTSGALELTLGS